MEQSALPELSPFIDFALDLSRKAGEHTLAWFGKKLEVESKSDESPVTVADRQTEVLCRKAIMEAWPGHGIIGEEYGEEPDRGSGFTWTIDPIDGTKSFISGLPLYTFLLSLMYRGEPVLGIIHQPVLGETAWAATGYGAWYNGAAARLRPCRDLASAWFLCTDPGHLLREYPGSLRLFRESRISRSWGDGYGYLMLASGRADIMIDPAMHIWDVAALKPIIKEAGGEFSDLQGRDIAGTSTLACAPGLRDQVLAILNDRETAS